MSDKKKTPSFALNAFTNIFSTPSVVTGPAGVPWYETLNGQDSVDMVYEYGQKVGEASIGIGYFLKRIRDKELFRELGYDTMSALAKEKFNMDESAVSRLVNLCEKYSENNNSPVLDSKYKEYNQSQLIEMLSIQDEKIIEEITPDTTVREIRELKRKASNDPTDEDIRTFFNSELRRSITPEQWADLKNHMSKTYRHSYYGATDFHYEGSLRGISINHSDEITWAKFVSRVYLLEDLVPDSINNQTKNIQIKDAEDMLPGQMHIEEHFPQYCPDNHKADEGSKVVLDNCENCDVAISNIVKCAPIVKFPEKEDIVIVNGIYRDITATDESERVNLFKSSLTEKEQLELSDYLDGFSQWYDNYFDEDSPDNDFHSDLKGLYVMIKLLEKRVL